MMNAPIYYVLVWEEDPDSPETPESERNAKCRQNFQFNLKKAGVELEKAVSFTTKKHLHFLKLYVTWETMCYYAENLKLRAPLKPLESLPQSGCYAKILRDNPLRSDVPWPSHLYYTCVFSTAKMHNFIGIDRGDAYFSQKQRHLVAYEILATRPFGNARRYEIGIERMINDGLYIGAFPLHEGPYQPTPLSFEPTITSNSNCQTDRKADGTPPQQSTSSQSAQNLRQILRLYWASWRCWYRHQPLDHVCDYFGEKIAFFFAWLGFYTTWLAPATLVGVCVFAYGLVSLPFSVISAESCERTESFKMCPFCDEKHGCQFWYLSDVCWKMKLAHVFDNHGTVFYAVFMSIWSLTFLEFWKRRSATLSHRWGVNHFRVEISRPRPDFAARCNQYRENRITGKMEPYFSNSRRLPRIIVSYACLIFMLAIVIWFIILVITFQSMIIVYLVRVPALRPTARAISTAMGALVHLLLMLVLEAVYKQLAYRLTKWEVHKTQWEFDDQLTMKIFIFEVWNYYSSIFYIAFFKGRFSGYPGNYISLFGYRPEECDEGGCLLDLALSLAIVMIGRQTLNNVIDVILPSIRIKIHRFRTGSFLTTPTPDGEKLEAWETDYCLLSFDGLWDDFLQLVLQFGFATIFVAAFPLAPLFALINNVLAVRIVAKRLIENTRRPLSLASQGIGMWENLLEIIAGVSVISNAFLLAFTSDFLPMLLYQYEYHADLRGFTNFSLAWSPANTTSEPCRYRNYRDSQGQLTPFYWKLLVVQLAFVIIFEHLVFFIRRLLLTFIPSTPKELLEQIERRNYLGRQALIDAEMRQRLMQKNRQRQSQFFNQQQEQQPQQQKQHEEEKEQAQRQESMQEQDLPQENQQRHLHNRIHSKKLRTKKTVKIADNSDAVV